MFELLSNDGLRAEAEALAQAGAADSAWPVLGRRYAQLYRDLAARSSSAATAQDAARA
jgi:hypothetical protein